MSHSSVLLFRVFLLCLVVVASTADRSTVRSKDDAAVPIDFYVMSKCPDAEYCEAFYADAISSISSIASVSMNYIASESSIGVFSCLHGKSECEGNKMQLCVSYLYPNDKMNPATNRPLFFDFALCQSESRSSIPANGEQCAQSLSLDWDSINNCAHDKTLSDTLFRNSIKKTSLANVTVSCTINIAAEEFCQHDGVWKNCPKGYSVNDFVTTVCAAYKGSTPPSICESRRKHQ